MDELNLIRKKIDESIVNLNGVSNQIDYATEMAGYKSQYLISAREELQHGILQLKSGVNNIKAIANEVKRKQSLNECQINEIYVENKRNLTLILLEIYELLLKDMPLPPTIMLLDAIHSYIEYKNENFYKNSIISAGHTERLEYVANILHQFYCLIRDTQKIGN